MEWAGPVSAALKQTRAINEGQEVLADEFWSPARIVRAAVDSKVRGPERAELISHAADVALRIYAGVPAHEQLEELEHKLKTTNLLGVTTEQTVDYSSMGAYAADKSEATSAKIAEKLPEEPLFIVALCHGGLVAALQTALYSARRQDVTVYPIRSSIRKHGDRGLYLPDDDEYRRVTALTKNRHAIIHDEDASSGTTIEQAVVSLRRITSRTNILGVANADHRSDKERARQGEWWERV